MKISRYRVYFFSIVSPLSLIILPINGVILFPLLNSIEAQPSEIINIVFNANNPGNNNFFDPISKSVNTGTKVTWINNDSTFHTVISGSYDTGPTGKFQSELIVTGDAYSYTFTDIGKFSYYCTLHPFMTGTIIVN
jgi:plastocyanin